MKTIQEIDDYDDPIKNHDTRQMFWYNRKKEIRGWNGVSVFAMVIYAILRYFNDYDIMPIGL